MGGSNQNEKTMSTDYQILKLYKNARDLIIYQPWRYMDEEHILLLSTNQNEKITNDLIFCHMTAHEENYYSFSIYIGDEGYESCKEFYDAMSNKTPTSMYLNALVRRTCLTLNFVHYEELSSFEKEIFKFVKLLPDGESYLCPQIRYQKSEGCPSLMIESDLCNQFIEILSHLKLIFMQEEYGSRISMFEDSIYTVFNVADNKITLSEQVASEMVLTEPKKFYYLNDLLVYRLKRMPKLPMTIEVIQFYISDSIIFTDSESEAKYARIYAFVETDEGQILCLYVQEEEQFNPYDVITLLANDCLRYEFRPDYFVTSDKRVYKMLEHFCEQIDVRVEMVEKTDIAEDFAESLFEELTEELAEAMWDELTAQSTQPNYEPNLQLVISSKTQSKKETNDLKVTTSESAEEIIISFMTTLYEELMEQHLIVGLSEGGMRHYKQIITIFAIEMQKKGSKNPMKWNPRVLVDVVRTRLEFALGIRLWVYAREVLEYHIALLGNEEMSENSKELLNALEEAFK